MMPIRETTMNDAHTEDDNDDDDDGTDHTAPQSKRRLMGMTIARAAAWDRRESRPSTMDIHERICCL
jgi:hypothetical protein